MNKGFAPIIDNNSRVLILGTFPSPKSRIVKEYYGNKNNKFWELIKDIFNNGSPFANYNEKKDCLLENNLALWDIIKECNSKNASDSTIDWGTATFNNISNLIKKYPNINKIILTSKTCEKWFHKKNSISGIKTFRLVSPSPAAAILYANKLYEWKTLFSKICQ